MLFQELFLRLYLVPGYITASICCFETAAAANIQASAAVSCKVVRMGALSPSQKTTRLH